MRKRRSKRVITASYKGTKLGHLITAIVLLGTITIAVALGVITGYMIISGILSAFANKNAVAAKPAATLEPQGVAGD
jgi:hypothetical protein